MRVLVVNAGSSSLKHAVVDPSDDAILARGEERWDPDETEPGRHADALRTALADAAPGVDAVGHRVVHGGTRFAGPVLLSPEVRSEIAGLAPLAPLHTRAALEGIDAALQTLPDVPHIACFDTAFHQTLPDEASTYALPREWNERFGLRRFGFHGLNVEWCVERAAAIAGTAATRRLVVCHLGSGCSATAVLDRRSVDTTMGFTPLEGVPMVARSGSVDPGLLLHLLDGRVEVAELEQALNHRSGLLGISGIGGGVRAIERAAESGDEAARLAVAIFVRGVAGAIAAMSTTLRGVDAVVFTGGVGEGSSAIRAAIVERVAHLGLTIDAEANAERPADADISAPGSSVRALVVTAGEEIVIARQTRRVVSATVSG
ncbi:MAG: acetate kinase [Solirubrobacterales bacterium]|nr:acetate kinase [Solirubrobacterales bacterium]